MGQLGNTRDEADINKNTFIFLMDFFGDDLVAPTAQTTSPSISADAFGDDLVPASSSTISADAFGDDLVPASSSTISSDAFGDDLLPASSSTISSDAFGDVPVPSTNISSENGLFSSSSDVLGDMVSETGGGQADPAAGFLAQEKASLGSLGSDLGLGIVSGVQKEDETGLSFFGGAQDKTGGEEASVFDGDKDDIKMNPNVSNNNDLVSDSPGSVFGGVPDAQEENTEEGGPFQTARPRRVTGEEQHFVAKWKKEQEERIRKKDAEEAQKMEELKQQAKKELADWYQSYEKELKEQKEENRAQEKAFLEDVNAKTPGTEWDRVVKNCDFNSKVSHATKDRSRMKQVLIQLKQNPLINRENGTGLI